MKHTKGPWGRLLEIAERIDGTPCETLAECPEVLIDLNCWLMDADDGERQYNPRIADAAPDLLAMLEQCRKAFDAMPEDVLGHDEREGWPYLEELKGRVDTTIARARGES